MSSPESLQDLIVRARHGDGAALEALLELIRPWLWQAARGFADPDRPDASTADLAQAAWLRAWQSLGQYQGPLDGQADDAQNRAMFRAWVLQIVRRLGMNAVRDRQAEHRRPPGRLQRIEAGPGDGSTAGWQPQHPQTPDPTPSAHAEADEQTGRIRAALERIADEDDRRIIELRFFEGLSLREVAETLGLNREDVRRRFHAAMRFLERELEDLR